MNKRNLAHARGSRDKDKVHVTAVIKNAKGHVIKTPRDGNPAIHDKRRHVYTNPKDKKNGEVVLPKAYKDAVKAKQMREHGHFKGI